MAVANSFVEIHQFKVTYKLNLIPEEGAQVLIIDSQRPIQSLMLQSKQSIDVLEVKDNLAVVNRAPSHALPDQVQFAVYLNVAGEEK